MNQYGSGQRPINYPQNKKLTSLLIAGLAGLVILILLWSRITVTIRSGEGGVLFETLGDGVDTENTYGEGFHLIAPWNTMFIYNVRQAQISEKMTVLSSNGLDIQIDVSLWTQPVIESLGFLHQEKGPEYIETIVRPSIRSAARSVVGRYTPEELYASKREAVQREIYEETKGILERQYVQLNEVLVRDITLPPTIKQAIESKLKQEQESLEYEFRIQKAEKEAERIRIEAEGRAEANRIINASLTEGVLRDKGIEATLQLSESPNSKVIVVGSGKDGLPLILGNN